MDNTIISDVITIDVLLSGESSQLVALPQKYRFTTESARDAYFAANPSELVAKLWVLVGDTLYQYIGNEWQSMVVAVTGPAGAPFKILGVVASIEALPSAEYAGPNEAYLVQGFEDGEHLYVIIDEEWTDQGAFSGVPGPKGDPGEAPKFRISDEGHLIAIYEGM